MNIHNKDNEPATKGDIRFLKGDLLTLKKELKGDIEKIGKDQEHYFHLVQNHFDEGFKTMKEWLIGTPEKITEINEKMEENDEEHRNFRVRIGALERRR